MRSTSLVRPTMRRASSRNRPSIGPVLIPSPATYKPTSATFAARYDTAHEREHVGLFRGVAALRAVRPQTVHVDAVGARQPSVDRRHERIVLPARVRGVGAPPEQGRHLRNALEVDRGERVGGRVGDGTDVVAVLHRG